MSILTKKQQVLEVLVENLNNPQPQVVDSELIADKLKMSMKDTCRLLKVMHEMGVVVSDIVEDGPAAESDLQEIAETRTNDGELVDIRVDIITAIDGVSVNSMNDLITYLARNTQPDQTITLTILRNGTEQIQIPLTLGSR